MDKITISFNLDKAIWLTLLLGEFFVILAVSGIILGIGLRAITDFSILFLYLPTIIFFAIAFLLLLLALMLAIIEIIRD